MTEAPSSSKRGTLITCLAIYAGVICTISTIVLIIMGLSYAGALEYIDTRSVTPLRMVPVHNSQYVCTNSCSSLPSDTTGLQICATIKNIFESKTINYTLTMPPSVALPCNGQYECSTNCTGTQFSSAFCRGAGNIACNVTEPIYSVTHCQCTQSSVQLCILTCNIVSNTSYNFNYQTRDGGSINFVDDDNTCIEEPEWEYHKSGQQKCIRNRFLKANVTEMSISYYLDDILRFGTYIEGITLDTTYRTIVAFSILMSTGIMSGITSIFLHMTRNKKIDYEPVSQF